MVANLVPRGLILEASHPVAILNSTEPAPSIGIFSYFIPYLVMTGL